VTRVNLEIIDSLVGATLNESMLKPLVENIDDTRVRAPDSFCTKIAIVPKFIDFLHFPLLPSIVPPPPNKCPNKDYTFTL
jgi:hypothetical protein